MPQQTENPPSLAELQDWLRWIFTEPSGIDAALSGARPPSAPRRRAEPLPRRLNWMEERPPIPLARRLAVYSDGYFLRLLEALQADFKTVHRVLGDGGFRELAADYLVANPSKSPNLTDLGANLPTFLRAHRFERAFPFLPELAKFEWAIVECLYSRRMPPLDSAKLEAIPEDAWAAMQLTFDPTARLLGLQWPVDALWQKRESRARLSLPKKPNPIATLLWRDDDWAQVRRLEPGERILIEKLEAGVRLGEACAALGNAAAAEKSAADVSRWFSDWIRLGIVKDIRNF